MNKRTAFIVASTAAAGVGLALGVADAQSVDAGDAAQWSALKTAQSNLVALEQARQDATEASRLARESLDAARQALLAYEGPYGSSEHKSKLEAFDAAVTAMAEAQTALEQAHRAADVAASTSKSAESSWYCSRSDVNCPGE